MNTKYDLIIVGAGPGGYIAAQKATKSGMHVLIIDRKEIGGTCVNRGCVSTKALIHVAKIYRQMQSCERFGLSGKDIGFDLQKIYEYKNASAQKVRNKIEESFSKSGITFVQGEALVQAHKTVRVTRPDGTTEYYQGQSIIIAAGAKARALDVPGASLPGIITSEELLTSNEKQYKSLVIIGGGVIGLELATVFNALGTDVTIIELSDRILPEMEAEFSDRLEANLCERGIHIYKKSIVERFTGQNGLSCEFLHNGKEITVSADNILMCVGREANTEGLFDSDVIVKKDHGKILVDQFFMTSQSGIYAIGDVIEGVQLAHVASAEATYVVERINRQKPSVLLSIVPQSTFTSISIIPNCLYTDPEISSVGLTEDMAARLGIAVRCGRYEMDNNTQSIIAKAEYGLIKVLFSKESDVILGAQIMCPRATDMIGELATAIANEMTAKQLTAAMRAQLTFNEGLSKAIENRMEE